MHGVPPSPSLISLAHHFDLFQATLERGLRSFNKAWSRDFAGFVCNLNDYVMHMHSMMETSAYIAPEFRTDKVISFGQLA